METKRSPKDWLLLFIFYIVLYACLSGFFLLMILALMATINDKEPKYILEESIIGTSPGISFVPRPPELESSLIWIKKNATKFGWEYWTERFNTSLQPYLKVKDSYNTETSAKNCELGNSPTDKSQFCRFNPLNVSGDQCSEKNYFGYLNRQPCLMFKLNKIYGWEPKLYNSLDDMPKEYRELRRNEYDRDHIGVTCAGSYPADKEHLGTVDYFPKYGFPKQYFPYVNQKGYLSPLVMVQFKNVTRNILISVECKLWAKNIEHDRQNKMGYIRLELLIDE